MLHSLDRSNNLRLDVYFPCAVAVIRSCEHVFGYIFLAFRVTHIKMALL